jgi:hypothetical protein
MVVLRLMLRFLAPSGTLSYLVGYLLTYLLTPWSRFLLQKLTGSELLNKFPAFNPYPANVENMVSSL